MFKFPIFSMIVFMVFLSGCITTADDCEYVNESDNSTIILKHDGTYIIDDCTITKGIYEIIDNEVHIEYVLFGTPQTWRLYIIDGGLMDEDGDFWAQV